MPTQAYPAPAFAFSVSVGDGPQTAIDASFQEASGLEASFDLEPLHEGGLNTGVHQLPTVTKSAHLVLRRGFVTGQSALAAWVRNTVGSYLEAPIATKTLEVRLLGPDSAPIIAWSFSRAWPVKWTIGPFDAARNDVLTEAMEFSYARVERRSVR